MSHIDNDTMNFDIQTSSQEDKPLLDRNEHKSTQNKSERVLSLDTVRGLTIIIMNFVNNAPGSYGFINHADWNGFTLADIVMPFFLFMVGSSLAISYHKPLSTGQSKLSLIYKAFIRSLKLFLIGLLLHGGGPPYDLGRIRIFGVLQRISVTFFIASLAVILLPRINYKGKYLSVFISYLPLHIFGIIILSISIILKNTIVPPGCDKATNTPDCNAVWYVDYKILTPRHMYCCASCRNMPIPCPYFEPEGILTTLSATYSLFIGLYFGYILIHFKNLHKLILIYFGTSSILLFILGLILHLTNIVPLNKNLYSESYILLNAGIIGMIFGIVYLFQDVLLFRKPFLPFVWTGMNSIILYVGDSLFGKIIGFPNGSSLFYFNEPKNNLSTFFFKYVLRSWMPSKLALLFWGLLHAIGWIIPAYILFKKKIFIRV